MEKELFKWKDWDLMDTLVISFYDCTLIKQIGKFPPGSWFSVITMDYSEGKISLYLEDDLGTSILYKLNLSIGDELTED